MRLFTQKIRIIGFRLGSMNGSQCDCINRLKSIPLVDYIYIKVIWLISNNVGLIFPDFSIVDDELRRKGFPNICARIPPTVLWNFGSYKDR